jgi:hypothetical protein
MGLLDTILPNVVKTAIKLVGGDAVIRRTTTKMDPATGSRSAQVTDYPVPVSPPEEYSLKDIDGTNVLRGDFTVEMAAESFRDGDALLEVDPATDVLVFNGKAFKIVDPGPVYSGNRVASYVLQCRK